MHVTPTPILSVIALLFSAAGCRRTTPPPSPPAASLVGDWTLVELDAQPAPLGAGGRAASLSFQTDPAQVGGFAGCNRLTAAYTVAGDSLRIGVAALTKMACTEGMDLERRLSEVLTATTRYQVTTTELTLVGEAGTLARFTRATR